MAKSTWFDDIARDIALADAIAQSAELLAGRVRGRLVVNVGLDVA